MDAAPVAVAAGDAAADAAGGRMRRRMQRGPDAAAEEDMYAPILKPQLLCWMLPPSTRRLVVDAIPIRALPFRL
jgi:hypothetical protein